MYVKHSAKINTREELALAVRQFAIQHGNLTDAGNIGEPTQFSLRNRNGWYFNFNFTHEMVATTCTREKPNGSITEGIGAWYNYNSNENTKYNYAVTYRLQFPLVSLHMISMGKQVIIVMETANQVFRHHVFGNMELFNDPNGIEFVGGTNAKYNYLYDNNYNNLYNVSQTNFHYYETRYELATPFLFGSMSSGTRTVDKAGAFIRQDDKFIILNAHGLSVQTNASNYLKTGLSYGNWTAMYVNDYNGRVQMHPYMVHYHYGFNTVSNPAVPYAYSNDIFIVNCRNIEPAQIINEDYIVFPVVTKLTTNAEFQTGNLGYAYRIK